MIPGIKYNPGTFTSRRPTPERFEHLRKWIEPVKRDIKITTITEMTNINEQLEQSANLFVSNIIQRVIAQLIGKYGDGFITIEGTAGGALKVEEQNSKRIVLQAPISFAGAANNCVVSLVAGKKIKICNIMFTVAAEVNLTLRSGTTALSGVLDFGADGEPRGMVHNFGDFPLETLTGQSFCILASTGAQVSGYVTYFLE